MKVKFDVTGMSCAACSANITKKVGKMEGVEDVNVNLLQNTMVATFDEAVVTAEDIINKVVAIGYGASEAGAGGAKNSPSQVSCQGGSCNVGKGGVSSQLETEEENLKTRLIWSAVLLMVLMYVSMGSMVGLPLPGFLQGHGGAVAFAFTQFLIATPVLVLNKKFFQVGTKGIINRVPNMDSLVAVGSGAAYIYGIFAIYRMAYGLGTGDMELVARYHHDLYFESSAMILVLVSVGKFLEERSKGKTSRAIEKLMDLSPKVTSVLRNGEEVQVDSESLVIGDQIVIRQGERIPVDGIVIKGEASMDESTITGESIPVAKAKDDQVTSGTICLSGYIVFEAKRVGEDTTLAKIIALVNEAASSKAPISKLADKVAGIFVPAVMLIALVTAVGWMAAGQSFEFALARAITVLVISCPCALGLATPTAIMVGTGYGASHGILIKSAESLELLGKVGKIFFDKTGTLTKAKPQVTDFILKDGAKREEILGAVDALEKQSSHPLSLAVVNYCQGTKTSQAKVLSFKNVAGMGIEGEVELLENNSKAYFKAGNQKMMSGENLQGEGFDRKAEELAKEGKTCIFVAKDGVVVALVAIMDEIKESSKVAVSRLKALGIETVMLTGDNKVTGEAVGKMVGIDRIIAQVMPDDKDSIVGEAMGAVPVAMVGDGVNDAPALTRADVGIAIGAGTDVAIESADVVLARSDAKDVALAVELSRAVIRNIKQNLFWAFFYNVLGIPVAAGLLYPAFGIVLNPMIGAAAMSMSSLFVVGNALRLRNFKGHANDEADACDQKAVGNDDAANDDPACGEDVENKVDSDNEINDGINNEEDKMKKVMTIEGMMCMHCKANVEKVLGGLGAEAVVDLDAKTATLTMDSEIADEVLTEAITEAGYEVKNVETL